MWCIQSVKETPLRFESLNHNNPARKSIWVPYGFPCGPHMGCPYGPHLGFATGIHMGPIWAAHLGPIWATCGSHLGPIWAVSGLHVGPIWAVSGLLSAYIHASCRLYIGHACVLNCSLILHPSHLLHWSVHTVFTSYKCIQRLNKL